MLGAVLLSPVNAWADSKSASVRISCTVVPMIEMSHQKTFSVHTNLQNRYLSSDSMVERGGQKIHLHSITAL